VLASKADPIKHYLGKRPYTEITSLQRLVVEPAKWPEMWLQTMEAHSAEWYPCVLSERHNNASQRCIVNATEWLSLVSYDMRSIDNGEWGKSPEPL
jgi:hypothetical protein